jgi:membrane-bound lytic murein transglycosylase B
MIHAVKNLRMLCVLGLIAACLNPAAAQANDAGFHAWLQQFRVDAVKAGIRADVVDNALRDVEFLPRVIELDNKQPEKTRSFNAYRRDILSAKRVADGRRLYREHRVLLRSIEEEYGVPASIIVALWGIETHYGKITGGFEIIDSLATLAYEGRREAYFREELIEALRILQEGHVTRHKMKGSWAGAMGQNQFMPSSFLRFAQDHNNDGKRDIWGTLPDVFASSANYLNQSGWVEGERWGRAVKLSPSFDTTQIGLEITRPISTWSHLGVTLPNGGKLPVSDMSASIVRPEGKGREAYLVYPNYRTIMAWNRSTYFATSVGLLSDLIANGH